MHGLFIVLRLADLSKLPLHGLIDAYSSGSWVFEFPSPSVLDFDCGLEKSEGFSFRSRHACVAQGSYIRDVLHSGSEGSRDQRPRDSPRPTVPTVGKQNGRSRENEQLAVEGLSCFSMPWRT